MKASAFAILLALFLDFAPGYGQKNYSFDYVMEYQWEQVGEGGKQLTRKHYQFINSVNSGYVLLVYENGDEIGMKLLLDGGKYYYGTIARDDFFVEAISLKCPATGTDHASVKLKDFKVVPKSDTLINTQPFHHFILEPVNEKKFRNKELSRADYVMDNSLLLNYPALLAFDTAYRLWKEGEPVKDGFVKELTITGKDGKVTSTTRLLQYMKVQKYIIVDSNCK